MDLLDKLMSDHSDCLQVDSGTGNCLVIVLLYKTMKKEILKRLKFGSC